MNEFKLQMPKKKKHSIMWIFLTFLLKNRNHATNSVYFNDGNIFFFIFKLHIHTWHTLTNALTVPIGLFLIITTINSYVQMNVSKTFNDWLYAQLYAHFNTMAILIRFYILWLWWLFESKIRSFVHITTFTAIDFDRSLSWF